jgi:hypothetical protein
VDRFGLLATTLKNAKITFHISVLCFLASAYSPGLIFFALSGAKKAPNAPGQGKKGELGAKLPRNAPEKLNEYG